MFECNRKKKLHLSLKINVHIHLIHTKSMGMWLHRWRIRFKNDFFLRSMNFFFFVCCKQVVFTFKNALNWCKNVSDSAIHLKILPHLMTISTWKFICCVWKSSIRTFRFAMLKMRITIIIRVIFFFFCFLPSYITLWRWMSLSHPFQMIVYVLGFLSYNNKFFFSVAQLSFSVSVMCAHFCWWFWCVRKIIWNS